MNRKLLFALVALWVLTMPGNAKRYSLASAIRAQNKQVIAELNENLRVSSKQTAVSDSVTDADLLFLTAKFGTYLPTQEVLQERWINDEPVELKATIPSDEVKKAFAMHHFNVSALIAASMVRHCDFFGFDYGSATLGEAYVLYQDLSRFSKDELALLAEYLHVVYHDYATERATTFEAIYDQALWGCGSDGFPFHFVAVDLLVDGLKRMSDYICSHPELKSRRNLIMKNFYCFYWPEKGSDSYNKPFSFEEDWPIIRERINSGEADCYF